MDNKNRVALDNDDSENFEYKSAKSNKKSIFHKEASSQPPPGYNFSKLADGVAQKINDRNKMGIELASQFLELIKSKTLPINKSKLSDEAESSLRKQLISWVVEINNDPEESLDGMGSAGALTLLLKTLFLQRDRINELDYRLTQLEKELGVNYPQH